MRPELNTNLDPSLFLEYYWLKEELSDFCRTQALPASGSKDELTARIHSFLKDGTVAEKRPRKKSCATIHLRLTSLAGFPDPGRIPERRTSSIFFQERNRRTLQVQRPVHGLDENQRRKNISTSHRRVAAD